jgi:hypothetical protein
MCVQITSKVAFRRLECDSFPHYSTNLGTRHIKDGITFKYRIHAYFSLFLQTLSFKYFAPKSIYRATLEMREQTRVTLDVKSRYVCPTLTETGMCPEISVNLKNTRPNKNVFSDYRVVTCVEEHTLTSTLH